MNTQAAPDGILFLATPTLLILSPETVIPCANDFSGSGKNAAFPGPDVSFAFAPGSAALFLRRRTA
jgi:hypothetical protein